ncbi:MAG: type II toxin-antitoxin system VapC family toxin [Leptolyngbyaceae cyanobacterium SL_5_9]|nr:type II toxin-antitoxin system VapC family toxin [Leptolyngbyaceae cyanobacterium SL_5_9]NJO73307.1 type II toxin-antitoxin system VapC family toxin [Leptolyngbyaceae cyanobacterium RM1_406_9]
MILYVMDTDHLSLYERGDPIIRNRILIIRQTASDSLAITVINVEEQCAGRLAQIRKATTTQALVFAYEKLKATLVLFSDIQVLDYDMRANDRFQEFREAGVRIGTQDLRIAAIALTHNATLLTRNLRDFERVPGLVIQDWSV